MQCAWSRGKIHRARYLVTNPNDGSQEPVCGMHLQQAIAITLAESERNGGSQFVTVSKVTEKRG